ncbi:MAG: permease-like cell division protein FtsX [Eubacteriales bacterium]|nr:permease-like cell division protein FtsX [Eubacteriales bacterium]
MKLSTFLYCTKQGFNNIRRNILFSLASIATVAACIFLFCLFFSIISNVRNIVEDAETTVGITVFFDENAGEAEKSAIGDAIREKGGIREINYITAEEAWDSFKKDYFGDRSEELAEAFADDNPLATSDSYEVFLNNIEDQQEMVAYIRSLPGVREVKYANALVSALKGINKVVSALSAVIIGVLLAVSVFLISNTISVAAAFRKRENEIMKLIGATNFMIRAPFVVEGVIIGFFGALIPLCGMYFIYVRATNYLLSRVFSMTSGVSAADIFKLLPIGEIFPQMLAVGLILGLGMGFIVSFFTIRKHLKI